MQPKPRQTWPGKFNPAPDGSSELLAISPWMLAGFHVIAQRRLRRAFRALRVAHASRAAEASTESLIVYLNHPSWWDPLVGFVLAKWLFGDRHFYAGMDAIALQRYRIFRRLGMFPVDRESSRGAAQFLRHGQAVLESGQILAVTPQGRFVDVRERPVQLRPGLATLLHRRLRQGQATTVLPMALEYTFWDQRLPEALVNCGEPLRFRPAEPLATRAELQTTLEAALVHAQDELAVLAMQRDAGVFESPLRGSTGSAGFYGLIEAVRAMLGQRNQSGDHNSQNGGHNSRNSVA